MEPMISIDKLTVERLNGGRPILQSVPDHEWENEVVFNPACVFLEERERIDRVARELSLPEPLKRRLNEQKGICVLIYRAQGRPTASGDYRNSRFGIALLTPTLGLIYRHPVPIMIPENDFEDLGVEDPRITRIGESFVMFYAGYSSHRVSTGEGADRNKIGICIALSDDLVHWEKKGPLQGELNNVDNKNAVLFPEKLDGSYYILHRPMEGIDPKTVHAAHSKAITGEWIDDGILMAAMEHPAYTKSWIGGGSPPLSVGRNEYLALYHTGHFKPDGMREYDIGLCKLKFDRKVEVTERIEFFMRPETREETIGNESLGVNNALFVCGAYLFDDYLYFPYGGADSVILAARIDLRAR